MQRIKLPPGTLIINMWSSTCNDCGRDCDPGEKSHQRVLGYSSKPGDKGCGVEWRHVTSEYGPEAEAAAAVLCPDLIPIRFSDYLVEEA